MADPLGLSAGQGLSRNQVAFGIAGLLLISAGVLGKRLPRIYKGAGTLLLNLLMVILVLEILSTVAIRIMAPAHLTMDAEMTDWEETGRMFRPAITRYAPWVLWRSDPSPEIDAMGLRITPGSSTAPDAYSVITLGGSTMWGTCSDMSSSIPAFCVEYLSHSSELQVSVTNLAQSGYVSTQEVIALMLELRSGNIPDLVICLDGFNDIWTAYHTGLPGIHDSYGVIKARIEGRDTGTGSLSPATQFLNSSSTMMLAGIMESRLGLDEARWEEHRVTYATLGVDMDSLATEVVGVYLENCSLIAHLAEVYGFECIFVWQPTLWCGDKPLTEFEISVRNGGDQFRPGGDPDFQTLLRTSYRLFLEERPDTVRYISMQDFFDETREQVYVDFTGVHVTSEANADIAAFLVAKVLEATPDLTSSSENSTP